MVPLPRFSVKMDITDVSYLTYIVPEERLRPAVPEAIPFAMTHEGRTFVSLVIFHNKNVRASLFPFIRFNYDQLNVRTYISDPVTGKPAVLFLHSGITSRTMSFATKLMGIPWPVMSLGINATYQNDALTGYSAVGEWEGKVNVRLGESLSSDYDYTPFKNIKDAIEFLVTPTVGYYTVSGGAVRFEVQHTSVVPSGRCAASVRFPMLEAHGYLTGEELQNPHNILVTPHAFFRVLLPPRFVRV